MESLTINAASDGNVKIRLIGHCIICLKKVSTGPPEEGSTENCVEQGYPEAAPKSLVSTPGFLATFREIWGYLQNGSEESSESNGGNVNGNSGKGPRITSTTTSFGISLQKVVAAGSEINVTFSRTTSPTICHQCFNKILAVENMMKVVRHQVRNIERLVKESRGGKFGGRAEQIQKTLQVFTLEVDDGGLEEDDRHLDSAEDDNDKDDVENEVEERPKRSRGRPPKPPVISDQEDSMDYQQDDNTNNSEDKEDPDFQIKVEPQDSDEDDGGDGDDGSNYSDEFLAAGSSAKSLRSSGGGGRLSSSQSKKEKPLPPSSAPKDSSFQYVEGTQRIRWQTIELTDKDIARDWRIRSTTVQKNGSISEYYCAHGKYCRVRIKKKVLKNGASLLTTNGREHSNHRDKSFGLTAEQKEFVHGCLEVGVNRPNNILVSFKAKGVPVPRKKQVCCYLGRIRRGEKSRVMSIKDDKGGKDEGKKGEEQREEDGEEEKS